MGKIILNDKEYALNYTLQALKNLQEKGISINNLQDKFTDDPVDTIAELVYEGLNRQIEMDIILSNVSLDVFNLVDEALQNSMPKSVQDTVKKLEEETNS